MTDTANHLVPEQGKFRRALAVVFAWLQAMEYTSFDYTLDRIERLEREVGQLKEELRQSRDPGPVDRAARAKISRPCENSPRSARKPRGRAGGSIRKGFPDLGSPGPAVAFGASVAAPGARAIPASGRDRGHHCLEAKDIERAAQIIDERRQAESGRTFRGRASGRRPDSSLFDGAERMSTISRRRSRSGLDLRRSAMRSSASSFSRRETSRKSRRCNANAADKRGRPPYWRSRSSSFREFPKRNGFSSCPAGQTYASCCVS